MSKPIHTYLDLDVVNNNLISDSIAPALRFEETRNTPFLEGDTSEYFAAIIRFSIQAGNSLPIFIPRIQTGQDDVDLTVYKVTLTVFASDGHLYESTTTVRHVTSDHTASATDAVYSAGPRWHLLLSVPRIGHRVYVQHRAEHSMDQSTG